MERSEHMEGVWVSNLQSDRLQKEITFSEDIERLNNELYFMNVGLCSDFKVYKR